MNRTISTLLPTTVILALAALALGVLVLAELAFAGWLLVHGPWGIIAVGTLAGLGLIGLGYLLACRLNDSMRPESPTLGNEEDPARCGATDVQACRLTGQLAQWLSQRDGGCADTGRGGRKLFCSVAHARSARAMAKSSFLSWAAANPRISSTCCNRDRFLFRRPPLRKGRE
jgi:hypothetical protein